MIVEVKSEHSISVLEKYTSSKICLWLGKMREFEDLRFGIYVLHVSNPRFSGFRRFCARSSGKLNKNWLIITFISKFSKLTENSKTLCLIYILYISYIFIIHMYIYIIYYILYMFIYIYYILCICMCICIIYIFVWLDIIIATLCFSKTWAKIYWPI